MHVPFCTDRCTYCAFATIANKPDLHQGLIDALIAEYDRVSLKPDGLETVYIGGGTPGLLAPRHLQQLLDALTKVGPLQDDAEVTLEVNPDNVRLESLAAWTELGVTRLSMGIQTFHDATLSRLGRHHDGARAKQALQLIADNWTGTWSADLLVGWENQTPDHLQSDLQSLVAYTPPHVSVYGLTLEPGTPLWHVHQIGRKQPLNSVESALLDDIWQSTLTYRGYERYEVSNFAKPGGRSRHNQAYWSNRDYLGIGPGSSSSQHPFRWSNVRDTGHYMRLLESGMGTKSWIERLAPPERLLESLAVGLRTKDGLPTSELDRRFGPSWRTEIEAGLAELSQLGLLEEVEPGDARALERRLRVPPSALTRADSIAGVLARTFRDLEHQTAHADPEGVQPRPTVQFRSGLDMTKDPTAPESKTP